MKRLHCNILNIYNLKYTIRADLYNKFICYTGLHVLLQIILPLLNDDTAIEVAYVSVNEAF